MSEENANLNEENVTSESPSQTPEVTENESIVDEITTNETTGFVPEEDLNNDFVSPIVDSPDDDLMIENLSAVDAREYVIAWMQEQKRLEREIAKLNIELEKWEKRMVLASEKNVPELVTEAQNMVNEINGKISKREASLEDIRVKTDLLKEKLSNMPKDIRTVDTDFLLMDLEHLVGKSIEQMTTDTIFDKLDAQKTLEDLKAKMKKPDNE